MPRGEPEVLVVGAGMVGAAAACLFARAGVRVAILEQAAPCSFDGSAPVGLRVSAISPGSTRVLEAAGAWTRVEASRHCPYRRMRVEDRAAGPALDRGGFLTGVVGVHLAAVALFVLWFRLRRTSPAEAQAVG